MHNLEAERDFGCLKKIIIQKGLKQWQSTFIYFANFDRKCLVKIVIPRDIRLNPMYNEESIFLFF